MIEPFLIAIAIGIICACMTYWIQSLIGNPADMEEDGTGMNTRAIFSFIGVWLGQQYWIREKRLENQLTNMQLSKWEEQREEAKRPNPFKSILCPFCFMVWVTIFVAPWLVWIAGISFWHLLYISSIGHVTLKFLMDRFG